MRKEDYTYNNSNRDTLEKVKLCWQLIRERKAINTVIFEVGRLSSITDYFLVTSGSSTRQVQAIARHLVDKMKERGIIPLGIEGEREAQWILIDYGDLVVHIFYDPIREFYDLEGLWIDAPRINLEDQEC
ncbi:MAG TPA: ribosome silencing factor [Desulfobacteraceae bacterium]|nr:ribosome silencing factor [Desulfobacteraceae bacterium]